MNFSTEIISIIKPQKKKSLSEMKINRMNLMHPKMNKFYHDAKTIRLFVEKNKNILKLLMELILHLLFVQVITVTITQLRKIFFIK